MSCYFCKKRGKTWTGDDPNCAFPNGRFNHVNWNCATMNYLRDISEELGLTWRYNDSSFGAVPFEINRDQLPNQGYIFMTWYKRRGKTGNAVVMEDDEPIWELDEHLAVEVVETYKGED